MSIWTLLIGAALAAPPRGWVGIGVGGSPGVSGLSGKYYMRRSAVQLIVGGWQLVGAEVDGGSGFGVSGDYLVEMPDLAYTQRFNLAWNVGVGATLARPVDDNRYVSAAAIAGLAVNLKDAPFDIAFELRPRVAILPNIWIDLFNYSAHVRYYF